MVLQKYPFVSVVMPCRNEARFIEGALNSVLTSDYPAGKMEVLVVDGMSTDGTREIICEIAKKHPQIRMLENPAKIVPAAMNIAIREAKGEFLIRLDCHSVFASNYISKCIEVMKRTGADNVGGYIKTLPGNNSAVAVAIAAATSSAFGVGNSAFRLKGPEQEVDTVPFGTYRTKLFDKVGFYDERLVRNQDIELNFRIRKNGGRIVISPEIELSYYNRASFKGIWQQSFHNGLWNPYTIWLVGSGLSLRHFIPMLFMFGILILLSMLVLWPVAAWLLAGYLLVYFAVGAAFATKISRQKSCNVVLVLWSFVVLHVAYGLGSLWATLTIPFKFPRRKKKHMRAPLADRK